ncbi:hypothetical protein EGW08_000979 [Elysia chlorotica]|uniref:Uncharacterized protein n=1 Tax=Elysia chlorotica TaxID=188477 RepID=A0A3S1CFG1_ELYCH|nr:hypothetical protein EGW08_000979 [Elysia chlorotica]
MNGVTKLFKVGKVPEALKMAHGREVWRIMIANAAENMILDGRVGVLPVTGALVGGAAINDCGCPIGTRCSLALGGAQCIPIGGLGVGGLDYGVGGLDYGVGGLDYGSRVYERNTFDRSGQCFPLSPACRATAFDRFQECRYTYSSVTGRCIKVYVTFGCSQYNTMSSLDKVRARQCERSHTKAGRNFLWCPRFQIEAGGTSFGAPPVTSSKTGSVCSIFMCVNCAETKSILAMDSDYVARIDNTLVWVGDLRGISIHLVTVDDLS